MGNYVDPDAVRPPIAIGPCGCPNTPHDTDYVTIAQELGYGDHGILNSLARSKGPEAYEQGVILVGVKAWTLVLPDGKPRPIDPTQVARLDRATVERLLEDDVLGQLFEGETDPPNGPSAPSANGSPESATSTLTSPAPEPSTTS